jgi:hypothetical protein
MHPAGLNLCPRAQWIPDESVNNCMLCRQSFDFVTRRHHCRICGRVVCNDCSNKQVRVKSEMVRACDQCRQTGYSAAGQQVPGSPLNRQLPPQQQQGYPAQQQPSGTYYASPSAPQPYASPVYPPQQQPGYPPPQQGYPPQQPGFPPPQQPGYPPPQQQGYPPQQQGYPPQQGGYPAGQMPPPQPYSPAGGPPPGAANAYGATPLDQAIGDFAMQNEIKPAYIPLLRRLVDYDVVVICDDSGSMSGPADPEDPSLSRWAELKQNMAILLRATAVFGLPIDVYFINRGVFRGITSYDQLRDAFSRPPSGGTNTVRVMQQIWADRCIGGGLPRPLIVHLFTDGHPTDDNFNEDINGFAYWLRRRPNMEQTFFSILLCTDDEEVCALYRPLEYRVAGRFGWAGATQGIQGVDVTEDYRGELRDIRALRGQNFRFSMGDYIVKCLVGAIDPSVHAIDLPAGASIYSVVAQRRSFW